MGQFVCVCMCVYTAHTRNQLLFLYCQRSLCKLVYQPLIFSSSVPPPTPPTPPPPPLSLSLSLSLSMSTDSQVDETHDDTLKEEQMEGLQPSETEQQENEERQDCGSEGDGCGDEKEEVVTKAESEESPMHEDLLKLLEEQNK